MKWRDRGRSGSLEDLRGSGGGGGGVPGGMGGRLPIPIPGGGKGGAGALVALLLVAFVARGACAGGGGGGLEDILTQLPNANAAQPGDGIPESQDPDRDLVSFVSYVFDDVQGLWVEQFRAADVDYTEATIALFDGPVPSGCGGAYPEIGPHYCPPDKKVYLDLGFFRELAGDRFGAPGDFAQAYVIAHELGHHVQSELGTSAQVRQRQQEDPGSANDWSVRLELQADCYAGVWAYTVFERGDLEQGDLEEALGAAAAVGDDRIQEKMQGEVNPESWTHGSAEQRQRWFNAGFESGDPDACDTFT